jgi:hypothetical protein
LSRLLPSVPISPPAQHHVRCNPFQNLHPTQTCFLLQYPILRMRNAQARVTHVSNQPECAGNCEQSTLSPPTGLSLCAAGLSLCAHFSFLIAASTFNPRQKASTQCCNRPSSWNRSAVQASLAPAPGISSLSPYFPPFSCRLAARLDHIVILNVQLSWRLLVARHLKEKAGSVHFVACSIPIISFRQAVSS